MHGRSAPGARAGLVRVWAPRAPRSLSCAAPLCPSPLATPPPFLPARSTIYKLNVHDNRRAFDERGWDVVSNFKPLALPYYFSEVQTRRAMRFAYELLKGRPQEEYTPLFGGEIIELVFTRQDWAEPVVFNTEKAPLSPEY